jgi:hypothetical protein
VTAVTSRQTKRGRPEKPPFSLRGPGESYSDVILRLAEGELRKYPPAKPGAF